MPERPASVTVSLCISKPLHWPEYSYMQWLAALCVYWHCAGCFASRYTIHPLDPSVELSHLKKNPVRQCHDCGSHKPSGRHQKSHWAQKSSLGALLVKTVRSHPVCYPYGMENCQEDSQSAPGTRGMGSPSVPNPLPQMGDTRHGQQAWKVCCQIQRLSGLCSGCSGDPVE